MWHGTLFLLIFMSYEIFIEIYKIVVVQIKLVIENAEIMKFLILLENYLNCKIKCLIYSNIYNRSDLFVDLEWKRGWPTFSLLPEYHELT